MKTCIRIGPLQIRLDPPAPSDRSGQELDVSCTKAFPHQITSLNPGDVTAIGGREYRRAK